jgi:hypothetical protein
MPTSAGLARPGRATLLHPKVLVVLDFLMLVYGVGFFVVATLYVLACEKM